jgi:hypothetical protein
VQCCRLRECGTPKVWTRLKGCQSFANAETCLANLKWHLVNSSLHYADPADVELLFETMEPETEELPKFWFEDAAPEPMPPPDAPPQHLLASLPKRHKAAAAIGNQGQSSSGSGGLGTVDVHVARAELTDNLTLRRSTLLTMLDCVERAAAAARHAISISTVARDAFETEEKRLSDCARQLSKICER